MRHLASTFKAVKQDTIWYKMRVQKPSYQASKNNHFVYHRLTTSTALQSRSNRQKEPVGNSSSQYHRCRRQRQSNNKHPSSLSIPPVQTQHNETQNQPKSFFFTHPNQTKPPCPPHRIKDKKERKQENASCHSRRKWEGKKKSKGKKKVNKTDFSCLPRPHVCPPCFSRPASHPLSESTHTNLGSTRTNGRDETDETRTNGTG